MSAAEVDHFFENPLDVDLSGIPNAFTITISDPIPKIQIGIDPLTIQPITIRPLDLSVRIKELPSIRAHLPANFSVGLSLLGYELVCIRLCGEAQVITEPYEPNPCERCDEDRVPAPPGVPAVQPPPPVAR